MASYLYVIVSGKDDSLYKIGITNDLNLRFNAIRSSERPITVLAVFHPKDANGCERYLHNKFIEHSEYGEWFRFKDRSFMQDVFDCCMNNLVDNSWFFGAGRAANPKDPDFLAAVESYYCFSYKFVEQLLGHKYVSPTLPLMLKQVGCVVKHSPDGRAYVTPKGIEKGLTRYKNIPISEISETPLQQKEKPVDSKNAVPDWLDESDLPF